MTRLAGKVALISGSGRGIGRALALKLAREGARIVVNDLDEEPAAEVVRTIKEFGGDAVACVGNVTDADFGDRFVDTAIKTFNGLDIIVSNAGYTLDGVVQKMGDDQFQKMLDVHVVAPSVSCAQLPSLSACSRSRKPPLAKRLFARWC